MDARKMPAKRSAGKAETTTATSPGSRDKPQTRRTGLVSQSRSHYTVRRPTPKNGNMEVHHRSHSNHGPKKWKELLIEFLMIFFAVTMGFFAENIREEIINREKEKHFIESLAEDINSDITQLQNYVQFKAGILLYCDSLQFIISHTNVFESSNAFYNYSRELARYVRYYPADRTIEQLKNGNMQLIRKWDVSNAISEYYSRTKFMQEVDQELNDEGLKYRRYLIEFLDLSRYDRTNQKGSYMDRDVQTRGNPPFLSPDPAKLKIIYNESFALQAFLNNCKRDAEELAKQGNQLLALLHKKYDF